MAGGRAYFFIFCFVCIAVQSRYAVAEISMTVAPPLIETTVPPGGVHTFKLSVSNTGDRPIDIRGYTGDIRLNADGTPEVLDAGETANSCAGWIELTDTRFTVDAGSKKVIGAKINVPRGIKGGRYAVILFESFLAENRKKGNVSLGARLGTIVMTTTPWALERKLEIPSIKIEHYDLRAPKRSQVKKNIQSVRFLILVKNTGNVHVKANGSIVIKNKEGKIVDRIAIKSGTGTVFPDGVRNFEAIWSNARSMMKGQYMAEARVSCKGGRQAKSEKEFSIK